MQSPHDEDFHDLIAERYETRSTIITSNLDPAEWQDAFPNLPPSTALAMTPTASCSTATATAPPNPCPTPRPSRSDNPHTPPGHKLLAPLRRRPPAHYADD